MDEKRERYLFATLSLSPFRDYLPFLSRFHPKNDAYSFNQCNVIVIGAVVLVMSSVKLLDFC